MCDIQIAERKKKLSTNIIVMNIKFHQTYRIEVETPASEEQHAMNFV